VEIVPAPRKFRDEMRDRAKRMVREARQQEPGLSVNAACKRIGPQLGILPDTLRGWCKQADVDDGRRPARVRGEDGQVGAADVPPVAVAAGLGQHADRDLHPRAGDQTAPDRLGDAQVGAAGVADRGDALRQGAPQVVQRLVVAVAERRLQLPQGVDAAHHHVHVAVEQARQHRRTGAVDRLVAVQPGSDLDDPAVLDDHVGRCCRGSRSVEDPAAGEHASRHVRTLGPHR